MSEMITKLWQRVSGTTPEPASTPALRVATASQATIQYPVGEDTRLLNRELTDLMFIERVLALASEMPSSRLMV